MGTLAQLFRMDGSSFGRINKAFITLLPKKQDATSMRDFRPINLLHSFAKLFTKLLSRRLAPHLNSLVASNQSAFIQKRCIHDNFMLVRQSAKRLHERRQSSTLLKLDIAQAFDSISWQFILEVLQTRALVTGGDPGLPSYSGPLPRESFLMDRRRLDNPSPRGAARLAWSRVCAPLKYGGLGIHNLELMGIALRARWLWAQRASQSLSWQGLQVPCSRQEREFAAASMTCVLGDGKSILFWEDRWLQGSSLHSWAPNLYNCILARVRQKLSVADALANNRWIRDLRGSLGVQAILQYLQQDETIDHILIGCPESLQLWWTVLSSLRLPQCFPSGDVSFHEWQCSCRLKVRREHCRGFDTIVTLGAWSIWKERNNRVFNNCSRPWSEVVVGMAQEAALWHLAHPLSQTLPS
uniref:Reverse transcriptase domain-containing protein n=1 Tax=Oryza meridionalis TaxID=40149 RepID=A0A0E0DT58_9ORYZ